MKKYLLILGALFFLASCSSGSDKTPPSLSGENTRNLTLSENAEIGTNIGSPIKASAGESGNLTYSLENNTSLSLTAATDYVAIDSYTGQLSSKAKLNYEDLPSDFSTNKKISFKVKVTESGSDLSDTQDLTLAITNINPSLEFSDGRINSSSSSSFSLT